MHIFETTPFSLPPYSPISKQQTDDRQAMINEVQQLSPCPVWLIWAFYYCFCFSLRPLGRSRTGSRILKLRERERGRQTETDREERERGRQRDRERGRQTDRQRGEREAERERERQAGRQTDRDRQTERKRVNVMKCAHLYVFVLVLGSYEMGRVDQTTL